MKNSLKEFYEDDPRLVPASVAIGSHSNHLYSFNCPVIDIPMGGGIHSGKIYEFFGWESVGKSTFALEIAKVFCNYWKIKKEPHVVLWIETESALDKSRAYWMGCDLSSFVVFEAQTVEDVHEIVKSRLVRCKKKGMHMLVVWDTVAAASTRNERDKGTNSGGMMEKPRALFEMFRDITIPLGDTDSAFIAVNQLRASIGKFAGAPQPPGGGAFKFHASARGRITKKGDLIEKIGNEEVKVGIKAEVFYDKNKLILPKQKSLICIKGETGIDFDLTMMEFMIEKGMVVKAGAWKKIKYPEKVRDPEARENKKPRAPNMVEANFQTELQFKEILEAKAPHLRDWMNYCCYSYYSQMSPYIKTKFIDHVWRHERMFYGGHMTTLTDKEKELAKMIHRKLEYLNNSEVSN